MACTGFTIPVTKDAGKCGGCKEYTVSEGESILFYFDWSADPRLCQAEEIVAVTSVIDTSALPANNGIITTANDAVLVDDTTKTETLIDASAAVEADDGVVTVTATTSKGQILKFCFKIDVKGCCAK